jgi:translation initiation factor IF-2
MRVYELAKQLGMENRDLIPELKRLGVAVASHSSALDDDAVRLALEKLGSKARSAAGEAGAESVGVGHDVKRIHRPSRDAAHEGGSRAHALPQEESHKPDKKRILIKKKKEDGIEEPTPAVTAESALPSAPPVTAPAPALAEAVAAPLAGPPVSELTAQPPVPAAQPEAPATAKPATAPAPTPATATPALDSLTAVGKKKSFSVETLEAEAAARDKLKKVRKGPRTREEDETKFRNDATRWEDLRAIPVQRREDRSKHIHHATPAEITKPRRKSVKLVAGVSVKEFAELIGQRPAEIV